MAQPPNQLAKIFPTAWDANAGTHYSKLTDAVNNLLGYNGPAVISNSLDVRGNNVQNVANPVSGTDAMNLQTAEAKYSPSVTSSQLDVTGSNPLKGLTYLYYQKYVNQIIAGAGIAVTPSAGTGKVTVSGAGFTGTITTAKLTSGGTNGSMNFSGGILMSEVAAT